MWYVGKLLLWGACGWRLRGCFEASIYIWLKEGASGTESRGFGLGDIVQLFAEFIGGQGVEMGFEGSGPGECVCLVREVEVEGLETVVGVDVVDRVTTLFGL